MDAFWVFFLIVLGACVGSFCNVLIYRLPRGESVVFPPSHCTACGRAIKWYDNVPILSWLVLRGRCRFCRAAISPRYILVEAGTAAIIAGLYVCYFVLQIRDGAGEFGRAWPMFVAHAALLCGLLVCTVVDVTHWIVPLEVCWIVSLIGVAASAAAPHAWMPPISPVAGAMSLAAAAGLVVANLLLRYRLLQRSFIGASDKPRPTKDETAKPGKPKPPAVAITAAHGVNPRKEILRELLFLAVPLAFAFGAHMLLTRVPAAADVAERLTSGPVGKHVNALLAAMLGYLVGGLWIWGIRILGTLAFGKEAMGLGDVHIMAAVGAVTGWIVPSITFFVAPVIGVAWAVALWLKKRQRELPY